MNVEELMKQILLEMQQLKTEVQGVKSEVQEVKSGLHQVQSEVRVLNAKVDRIETKLDATFNHEANRSEEITVLHRKVRYMNSRIADVELEFYGQKDQQ